MKQTAQMALIGLIAVTVGCSTTQAEQRAGELTVTSCEAPVAQELERLVGSWRLELQADEGWTGYGESVITWDHLRSCSLLETQTAVFNQESPNPFENASTQVITFDSLSDTLKVLSNDRRGYTHLGLGDGLALEGLSFYIARKGNEQSERRIHYRNLAPNSFEWAWQGRLEEDGEWQDRLVVRYFR